MNDIPDNVVTIVAIIALSAIGLIAVVKDFNHGILQLCIMVISGLAGYKIKGIVDQKTIDTLRGVTGDGTPKETKSILRRIRRAL